MSSLERNNRKKRKRNAFSFQRKGGENDPQPVETPKAACIGESDSDSISFLEFRRSTIELYSALNWLGPGVMAVYWFKEYLIREPFGWVQCPKQNFRKREEKRRKLQQNSKGNFYIIPGQYLRDVEEESDTIAAVKDLVIQNVLDFGTPGVHYATSYIGVYNLLRSYGKFATKTETNPQSSKWYKAERKSKAFLVLYNGPPLPH